MTSEKTSWAGLMQYEFCEEQMELDPLFADRPTLAQLGVDADHEAHISALEAEQYEDNVNWWATLPTTHQPATTDEHTKARQQR